MGERQALPFRASPPFEGWKKDYSRITIEIQNPLPLEGIPDGVPCPACDGPVYKTYLDWEIPSSFDDQEKLMVTVSNTAGYKCAEGCAMAWPSNTGLLQIIDQAIPVFQKEGLRKTVKALQYTKRVLLEIALLPNHDLTEIKN